MKNYFTPEWLSWVFTFAIIIPVLLIAVFARKNSPHQKQNLILGSIIFRTYPDDV
jgi:hypothetical protein